MIPRSTAPPALLEAWDRMIQAWQDAQGKRWDDPAWVKHESATKEYRKACRAHGYKPRRGRAGIAIYPSIQPRTT